MSDKASVTTVRCTIDGWH